MSNVALTTAVLGFLLRERDRKRLSTSRTYLSNSCLVMNQVALTTAELPTRRDCGECLSAMDTLGHHTMFALVLIGTGERTEPFLVRCRILGDLEMCATYKACSGGSCLVMSQVALSTTVFLRSPWALTEGLATRGTLLFHDLSAMSQPVHNLRPALLVNDGIMLLWD